MTINLSGNTFLPPVITIPSAMVITAATRANPMVITVSPNSDQSNTYIPGQAVLLNVPQTYKMFQANGLVGTILSVSGNNISLNIDSTLFDPFVVPATGQYQPATIAPNGSRNYQYSNTSSPVPFQNLNNQGN